MSETLVNQALFGYSRGHRLLAASLDLDAETSRLLRTVTDTAFEGRSDAYLTVVSLSAQRAKAFVRTWPAPEWTRPGAVWSHVLIVDHPALARTARIGDVLELFRRPAVSDGLEFDTTIAYYRSPIRWSPRERVVDRQIRRDVALDVIEGVYGAAGPTRVTVEDATHVDETLMAIYEQQWPRLRRSFSFRTRYRTSETPWKIDLEVLERGGGTQPTHGVGPEWARILADDLESPRPELRRFLNRYGAESRHGRADMRPLVEIFRSLRYDTRDYVQVAQAVATRYPDAREMRAIKRDLFGGEPPRAHEVSTPSEIERLRAAFSILGAVDPAELRLGERVARLALAENPENVLETFEVDLAKVPVEHIEALVADIATYLDPQSAAAFAKLHEDLGLLVIRRRPELLAEPEIWRQLDGDDLGEVFATLASRSQDDILWALLMSGDSLAIAAACVTAPDSWWRLVLAVGDNATSVDEVVESARPLRQALDRIGTATLGQPPRNFNHQAALTLLIAAPLAAGVWRRLPPRTWLSVHGATLRLSSDHRFGWILDRLQAVTLLSGSTSGDPLARERAWRATFPRLHRALADSNFDGEAWALLANALPSGPEWDRCYRLRRGAVAEIRRDAWDTSATSEVVQSAGPQGRDMVEQLHRKRGAKDSWFSDLMRLLGGH